MDRKKIWKFELGKEFTKFKNFYKDNQTLRKSRTVVLKWTAESWEGLKGQSLFPFSMVHQVNKPVKLGSQPSHLFPKITYLQGGTKFWEDRVVPVSLQ